MKYAIHLIAVMMLFGCHSNKPSTDIPTNPNTAQTNANYRFGVSFISIGAGTDIKSREQFDQFITTFEQKNKVKLKYTTTNWGREGEVDYCFILTELDKKKQEEFITKTKELLKTSSLVRYKENEDCHH